MTQVHGDVRAMHAQLQELLKELQSAGERKGKLIEARRQLGAQRSENELVRDELARLEPEAAVYKLIGPALVPQDQSDAKSIVANRLEYIQGELKRTDIAIADLERSEADLQKRAQELYRKMQERQAQLAQQQQQQQAASVVAP